MQKQEVFALTENGLGETELTKHSVQLNDSTLITTPPRRVPYALKNWRVYYRNCWILAVLSHLPVLLHQD